MRAGFFARWTGRRAPEAPETVADVDAGRPIAAPPDVARIVREIAHQGLPPAPRKAAISLRIDADILEWFKAQGPGYQTRIHAVLRAYKDAAN